MKRKDYLNSIGKFKDGNITYTYSAKFLLPILGFTVKDLEKSLINVHINDEGNRLYVILNPDIEETVQYIVRFRILGTFMNESHLEDEIVLEFEIPDVYTEVIKRFKVGNYSGFEEFYKRYLTKYYGANVIQNGVKVSMYDTIFPRYEKRKAIAEHLDTDIKLIQEVLDSPEMDYEIYKPIEQLIGQLNE